MSTDELSAVTTLPRVPDLVADGVDTTPVATGELALLPYLSALSRLANDVDDSDGSERGRIRGDWWRADPQPHDARIQELSLVLAWFFTNERPWNPYARSPELCARLELAVERYLGLQHDDGSWPEYAAEQHSRSATGFALETLAHVNGFLRDADALPELRALITEASRRAMRWYFDPRNSMIWWRQYVPIANQPAGAIAGALLALTLDPDAELSAAVGDRLDFLLRYGQSPAGFFHESVGQDLQYSLGVMLPRLGDIHRLTGRTDVLDAVSLFADWYSYNAVLEPDGTGYFTNVASCARTSVPFVGFGPTVRHPDGSLDELAERVPALRGFVPSLDDSARPALEAEAADLGRAGRIASPHMVVETRPAIPASAASAASDAVAAVAVAPYASGEEFAVVRSDPREQHYLFVRRLGYYLTGHFGLRADARVRSGPALVWHPSLGTVIQGGNDGDVPEWTTVLADGTIVAAEDAFVQFYSGPPVHSALIAATELPRESGFGLRWSDGKNRHQTDLLFAARGFEKTVHAAGPCEERIPLVLREDDTVTLADGRLTVRNLATTMTVAWDASNRATLESAAGAGLPVGRRRSILRITQQETGPLAVKVSFDD